MGRGSPYHAAVIQMVTQEITVESGPLATKPGDAYQKFNRNKHFDRLADIYAWNRDTRTLKFQKVTLSSNPFSKTYVAEKLLATQPHSSHLTC